jgi:cephalosporin-C deacetylase-like acetyl esterase
VWTSRFLLLLVVAASAHAADDGYDALLRWMDGIAQKQLADRSARIAAITTVPQAETRKTAVRRKILESIGGLPDYAGPLNPSVTGRIDHRDYVIEKVIFESLPRLYVTANVYLPKRPGRHPGILLPLGHWWQGKPAVQVLAANLATKGFVVLAYDPLGQGERYQAYDKRMGESLAGGSTTQHYMAGGQALLAGETLAKYAMWDAKRALDYLVSRAEVDTERIGCTGCSGGGTLTTYISALDDRIKVAAPSCYMNSFRTLFAGRVGDSEQDIPNFIADGLDQTDFVELFAPKPWLITSTKEDFFTVEGARQVYEEARRWYGIYGAEEKIAFVVGPGKHGTPLEVRERIYDWMIRWLNNGQGDAREQPVAAHPDHELWATRTGQIATSLNSRDLYEVILDRLKQRATTGGGVQEQLRRFIGPRGTGAPRMRMLGGSKVAIETEPGLDIFGDLIVPQKSGRKPAVLVVHTGKTLPPVAQQLAGQGSIVLAITPRGLPLTVETRPLIGDGVSFHRALLIGRSLPGMRALDVLRAFDLLAAREDVDPARISATANGTAGVWLLMAAAMEPRFAKLWLDGTPASFRSAMEVPLHRNLHDAVLPGILLHGDIPDIAKLAGEMKILWTDPSNWTGQIVPVSGRFTYRTFEESDDRFVKAFAP